MIWERKLTKILSLNPKIEKNSIANENQKGFYDSKIKKIQKCLNR
jgi:hypothetical protein